MVKINDTKEKLLQTALDLIWANNYEAVSVDEICSHADVRKGSFYHYFESKAALAIAALEASWIELRRELDQIFSPQTAPLDRLRNYLEFIYQLQVNVLKKVGHVVGCPYTSLGCEQCAGEQGLREKAHEILQRIKKYIVAALRDAQQDGSIKVKDIERKADELFLYELGAHAHARLANSLAAMEHMEEAWFVLLGLEPQKKRRAA